MKSQVYGRLIPYPLAVEVNKKGNYPINEIIAFDFKCIIHDIL